MKIGFNLKMNPGSYEEFLELLNLYKKYIKEKNIIHYATFENLVVFAPFLYLLGQNQEKLKEYKIELGAQDGFFEDKGAFTGEISLFMLKNLKIKNVLVGHSERRRYFGENFETIYKKIKKALELEMEIFYLFGESQKSEDYKIVIEQEFSKVLEPLKSQNFDLSKIHYVYEPWWAISTQSGGESACQKYIEEVSNFIKELLKAHFSIEGPKIYYGGSCNSSNIPEILSIKSLNGFLVGSASLKQDEILKIFEILKINLV